MRMLLALRDTRTGAFLPPFTAATPGEAERVYMDILSREDSMVAKYPNDFPMYDIGRYDEFTGAVIPLMEGEVVIAPRLLLEAAQLLRPRKEA